MLTLVKEILERKTFYILNNYDDEIKLSLPQPV